MILRYLIFNLVALILVSCSFERIIDRSEKKRPSWVYGTEKNYLIIQGSGATHEEAKKDAIRQLKESIISSISVNVNTITQMSVNEELINDMSSYTETFSSNTKISSDFFSSLKGISLNKVSDYYWELKRMPEKIKKVNYHIRYPFSFEEHQKLIKESEQLDAQITEEINLLHQLYNEVESINKLQELIIRASILEKTVIGLRKSSAETVKRKSEALINQLKLVENKHEPGQLFVQLKSGGRIFNGGDYFSVRSNCAELIGQSYYQKAKSYVIEYDAHFCQGFDKDKITVEWQNQSIKVKEDFPISYNPFLVRLKLNGEVKLLPLRELNTEQKMWQIPMRAFNEGDFIIKKVELTVEKTKNKAFSIFTKQPNTYYLEQDINEKYQGNRDFSLSILAQESANPRKSNILVDFLKEKTEYVASGKIYYSLTGYEKAFVYAFELAPVKMLD